MNIPEFTKQCSAEALKRLEAFRDAQRQIKARVEAISEQRTEAEQVKTKWQGNTLKRILNAQPSRMMCATCSVLLSRMEYGYKHNAGKESVSCLKKPIPIPADHKTKKKSRKKLIRVR